MSRPALALLLAAACASPQRPPTGARDVRPAPWTLTYADGSANVYAFSQPAEGAPVAFEYRPVTPETSSTGFYSGGEPVQASLAADPRVDELWRRVRALEADAALHTEARGKGTGAFQLKDPAGERGFIVQMGPALSEFDSFVRGFRGPAPK